MSNYFDENIELKTRMFLTASTEDKEIIFCELYEPFLKLAENIIFTYKLYVPNEDIFDQKADGVSFLMTKIHKFNPELSTKAYSYFGTIMKRYYINKRVKYQKNEKNVDFDSNYCQNFVNELIDDVSNSNKNDEINNTIISLFSDYCNNVLLTGSTAETFVRITEGLNNVVKMVDELPAINKNYIYFLIKDQTGIDITKNITLAIKKLKNQYHNIKYNLLNSHDVYNE